ncbi:MAG: hypothetical protein JKY84_09470, partial [Emcibacteraceae bacterium]|nr:hypothetical protein [Emcibacteraceae bacterium]
MKQIKGPALFLAQFVGDETPYNSFEAIVEWAASLGYIGVQVPSWDSRIFDLEHAAKDQGYCDDLKETAAKYGVEIT